MLHLTLIASDNAAARALARVSPHGSTAFIDRMNEKAKELGLDQHAAMRIRRVCSSANVSSAYDMAKLITYVSGDERIAGVMRKQNYTVTAGRRVINIHSTNQLVMRGDVDVQAGKTGFIRSAGYCLATLLRLPSRTAGRRRRPGRQVECRPVLGNPPLVQLVLDQGAGSSGRRTGRSLRTEARHELTRH